MPTCACTACTACMHAGVVRAVHATRISLATCMFPRLRMQATRMFSPSVQALVLAQGLACDAHVPVLACPDTDTTACMRVQPRACMQRGCLSISRSVLPVHCAACGHAHVHCSRAATRMFSPFVQALVLALARTCPRPEPKSFCLAVQVNLARLLNGLGDTSLLDSNASALGITVQRSEQFDSLTLALRQERDPPISR